MKLILQLTGLVLTVSTLYVWSGVPITSFEPEYGEVISLSVPFPAGMGSQGVGSHASSLKTYRRTISVYSDYYIGRKMSNGVKYDPAKLTVASNDWKLGTRLRITYNGKSVTATVTDRMAKRFSGIRVDASTAVWRALGGGKPGLKKGAVIEVVK